MPSGDSFSYPFDRIKSRINSGEDGVERITEELTIAFGLTPQSSIALRRSLQLQLDRLASASEPRKKKTKNTKSVGYRATFIAPALATEAEAASINAARRLAAEKRNQQQQHAPSKSILQPRSLSSRAAMKFQETKTATPSLSSSSSSSSSSSKNASRKKPVTLEKKRKNDDQSPSTKSDNTTRPILRPQHQRNSSRYRGVSLTKRYVVLSTIVSIVSSSQLTATLPASSPTKLAWQRIRV